MQRGYNLLELAIAIAVLGLFLGMVLSSVNMVGSANSRNVINQVTAVTSAVYNFRLKYAALPGDASASIAQKNGFAERSGTAARGDSNERIDGCALNTPALGCETALFWRDLYDSKMAGITQRFAKDSAVDGSVPDFVITNYLPSVALGYDTFLHVYNTGEGNYFYMAAVSKVSSWGGVTTAPAFNPKQAYDIDRKMDDGSPVNGKLKAMRDFFTPATAPKAGTPGCVFASSSGLAYDANSAFNNQYTCQLSLRASF